MNRREVLTASAITIGAIALPGVLRAQNAVKGSLTKQVPAIWRHRIGDRVMTVVSDGYVPFEEWHSPNIDPADRAALLSEHFLPTDIYKGAINCFVVDDGNGSVVLVDAGAGRLLGPTSGHLIPNLAASGYGPEDITAIVATHLHPDHVGGIFDQGGQAVFPNAELLVSEADHAFWTDDGMRSAAPEKARFLWDIAGAALSTYKGRVRRFTGETEVLPGLTSIPLPGHTPGQSGVVISSGGDQLLIWADLVHFAPLQLKRPDVVFAFDVDPSEAVETRKRTFDRAASERLQIAGMHMPFPGTGHIVRDGDAYTFLPERWGYDL
ncbi:MAG: MBL fold metallo-hydrolase [Pseudomonadota bacterium]